MKEGRRSGAQIDGDIEHRPPDARYQLVLGRRRVLEMQAAQRPGGFGQRVVDLRHRQRKSDFGQFFGAEQPAEKPARIAGPPPLDNEYALDRRGKVLESRHDDQAAR